MDMNVITCNSSYATKIIVLHNNRYQTRMWLCQVCSLVWCLHSVIITRNNVSWFQAIPLESGTHYTQEQFWLETPLEQAPDFGCHYSPVLPQVQIDPYLEDSLCTMCSRVVGPYFCRDFKCFKYFCRSCWQWQHSIDGFQAHKPLTRTSKSTRSTWLPPLCRPSPMQSE